MNAPTGSLRRTAGRSRRLALLLGGALMVLSGRLQSAGDDPPEGFVWEELKAIHARILRPEKWVSRCGVSGAPPFKDLQSGTGGRPPYEFSSRPFEGLDWKTGVWVSADSKVKATYGKPADQHAAEMQAEMVGKNAVLRSWTKEGMPAEGCTAHAVFFLNKEGGEEDYMYGSIFVVNAAADTLYIITVKAPREAWKEVEPVGDRMLASLRIDPKF